jgi:hypothetical protein
MVLRSGSRFSPIIPRLQAEFGGDPAPLLLVGIIRIRICYHAASRTGQTSPIRPYVRSNLSCGFLWR